MSSTIRAKLCCRCHKEAEGVTKPLIMCTGCRRRWHPFCNNKIETRFGAAVIPDWLCERCEGKRNPTIISSSTSPASGAKDSRQVLAISRMKAAASKSSSIDLSMPRTGQDGFENLYQNQVCEKIGCENPVSKHTGLDNWKIGPQASRLCKQHEMEEKHKKASAARPDLMSNSVLNPTKPINKKRLYPKPTPKPQTDMFDGGFEVEACENHENMQTRSRGSRSKRGLRNSSISPAKAHRNTAGSHTMRTTSYETVQQIKKSDATKHTNQLDGPPALNIGSEPTELSMQLDPTETPPRPKLDLPKWQLEMIANVATTNAKAGRGDEEDERLVPSIGSPDYEPMLPSKSPTVVPSVGERDDDHYSPGFQLESEIGAFAQTNDAVSNSISNTSSALSSLSPTPSGETFQSPSAPSASHDAQGVSASINNPKVINSIPDGSPVNETERYKQRHLKVIMGVWGDDFIDKLPAWPEVPGKTFLEFLIKICRTERVSLVDFAEGISLAYKERTTGKENIKGHERYIKISDVKVFLARYHSAHQIATEQDIGQSTIFKPHRRAHHIYKDPMGENADKAMTFPVKNGTSPDMSRARMPEITRNNFQQPGFTAKDDHTADFAASPRKSSKTKLPEILKQTPITNSNDAHGQTDPSSFTEINFEKGRARVTRTSHTHSRLKARDGMYSDSFKESHNLAAAEAQTVDRRSESLLGKRKESHETLVDRSKNQNQCEYQSALDITTMFSTKRIKNLESKRQMKASGFDESMLDRFLYCTKREDNDPDPEAWGHVDPREAWPRGHVLTREFVDAKQAEIAARGNRKSASRFGKHLTSEVIEYRRGMGWQKHQNREFKTVGFAHVQPFQDLFGITRPDTMEPVQKGGKLWMQEMRSNEDDKEQDQGGGKIERVQAWPVLSAN